MESAMKACWNQRLALRFRHLIHPIYTLPLSIRLQDYLSGLVMDHPFIDGNKRIAASVLYLGLNANEVHFEVRDEEMIDEFLSLASGKIDYPAFLAWVKSKI